MNLIAQHSLPGVVASIGVIKGPLSSHGIDFLLVAFKEAKVISSIDPERFGASKRSLRLCLFLVPPPAFLLVQIGTSSLYGRYR